MERVLKPAGISSCREMICESGFMFPGFGGTRSAWDMFEDLLAAVHGHPQMGKDLKTHVVEAGFVHIRVTGSWDVCSTPAGAEFSFGFANQWLVSPGITEAAIKSGASTPELVDRIRDANVEWKDHSGAMCGLAFGEVVANWP